MSWSPIAEKQTARKRFDTSWQDLLDIQPFYGAKMFSLEIIETSDIPTMATDGKRVLYNPDFVHELSRKGNTFVEFHEMLHVMFLHHVISAEMKKELGSNYDHMIFNEAGDYEINQIIVQIIKEGRISRMEMPDDLLLDERFKGMLLREIYFILIAEKTSKGNGNEQSNGDADSSDSSSNDSGNSGDDSEGSGSGSSDARPTPMDDQMGDGSRSDGSGNDTANSTSKSVGHGWVLTPSNEDGNELTNDQIKELRIDAERENITASKFAKKMGHDSFGLADQVIERIQTPPRDWRADLEEHFTDYINGDNTWSKLKRNYYSQGIYMPGKRQEKVCRLALMDDQSSSVSDNLSALWVDVMNDVLGQFDRLEIIRIPFTSVAGQSIYYDETDLPLVLDNRMRGGTNFIAPFQALEESGFDVDVVLVLTDMCCSRYPDDPGIPTFWCEACDGYSRAGMSSPPFGEVIRIRE